MFFDRGENIEIKHSNRVTKNRRHVWNYSSPVPHPNFLRPESYISAANNFGHEGRSAFLNSTIILTSVNMNFTLRMKIKEHGNTGSTNKSFILP